MDARPRRVKEFYDGRAAERRIVESIESPNAHSATGCTKMRTFAWAALAAAVAASPPLAAQEHFGVEFLPELPSSHDVVIARIISEFGGSCFPDPAFSPISRTQRTVELLFFFTDACDPAFVGPSWDYPLGTFDAGSWVFVLKSCYSNPPPIESYCVNPIKTPFVVVAADEGVFRGGFD